MKHSRGMFVCESLQREVVSALAAEGLSDVEIVSFPCECGQKAGSAQAFERAWLSRSGEFAQLLVLGEPCVPAQHLQAMAAGRANVRFMASGFELFLPRALVGKYQCDGAYLLTPGWLANWPERMKRWGFDQATAAAFFAESCERLVLLDTGTDAGSSTQLQAFAAFVNRPGEIVPVGLEMLRLRLAQHWRDWPQTPSAPTVALSSMQSVADYALIFDLLSRLVGFTSETDLVRGLFELFEMICAPAGLAYLPFRDEKAGKMIVSPGATITSVEWVERLSGSRSDCTWLAERDGFVVRIQQDREMLGALLVDRVALPLRKADYLNLTLAILPVLALVITNARNMERLIQAKDMLHEKRKLAAVGTLACGMGHEINNPIMGIINYAQLIKDRLQGKSEAVEAFAGEIVIEAERIAGIVRGLFAFANRDIATRADVPVSDLVESVLSATRVLLSQDNIKCEIDVPADLPAVSCGRRQIVEVLTGLLTNARDALNGRFPGSDDDKRIMISARVHGGRQAPAAVDEEVATEPRRPPDKDTVMEGGRPRPPGNWLRLTVEDHGTGISGGVRERIFEPFFTTKDKSVGAGSIGKGLGLFVSYATVQEHGGAMSVETEVGHWTRVHVDLPIVDCGVPSMAMDDSTKDT